MLKFSQFLVLFLISTLSMAQTTPWNWPTDPELEKQTKEKQAYYKVQMGLEDPNGALQTLSWIYTKVPNLHPSIYQDGAKVIEDILKTEQNPARTARLEDSLMWTFDQRITLFDDKSALDRKAYAAFKLYYKTPAKFASTIELYYSLFKLPADQISDFNLTPFMTLATYYYKAKPAELNEEAVLDIHDQITQVIDTKILQGGNKEKLIKEQDKVDAFLNSIGNVLTCSFIEEKLVPKQKANPGDLKLAKKIFSYSLKAKCTDQPYFTEALVTLYESEPTFNIAKALGDKYVASGDPTKAMEYYSKAESMAQSNEEKFEVLFGQAVVQSKLGNKVKSRALAYEALSVQPNSEKAFTLIGNLYYNSFQECAEEESKVKDRAVFIAAYEMYKKAGNVDQMNVAKEQFPTIEDIFSENLEEGKPYTVGCWINETVILRRR